jgi:hypothetical protein
LPPNLHLLKTVDAKPTSTQNGCRQTYIYSKQLPPNLHLLKKRWERFLIMKLEESMVGEDSELVVMCYE